jgi:hypothetical protein
MVRHRFIFGSGGITGLLLWSDSLVFILGGTNEIIGGITMDKDFLEDLLAEFLFIQVRSTTVFLRKFNHIFVASISPRSPI